MKLCLRSSQPFLLQLRTEQNAERQAEIRILQISAKHLRDMGKAIEKRRAVQLESRCRSGDGMDVVEVDAQRLRLRDLRSFVMRFELFQSVRIIDPRGPP